MFFIALKANNCIKGPFFTKKKKKPWPKVKTLLRSESWPA